MMTIKNNIKKLCLLTVAALTINACGCGSDQYAIEKQYYKATKQAEKIFKNPHGSPPGELNKTVETLSKFAAKYPKNALSVNAQLTVARLYIIKEEYEKARRELEKIINAYDKSETISAEATFLIGNSYEIQNKWDLALMQYKKIMQTYPTTLKGINIPIYIIQHYKIKFQPEKMREASSEAISHYNNLIEKYPSSTLAYRAQLLIAQCYILLKDWTNTIDTYNKMIDAYKKKMNMDGVLMNIAMLYKNQLKDKIKTKETLERLIQEYPKSKLISTAKNILQNLK